ncbi:MAG TPA: hypothetical protein VK894_04030 [Jiangellales bacterium]|nr:hypothetical protein [Jiangellales bacterium]
MTTTTRASTNSTARLLAVLVIAAGAVMIVAGAATWFLVQDSLADERITVSEDAPRFAGDAVDGPLTAYQEAEMIEQHYLESTEGKTYAELDREDPLRQTAMTASFLRASLFTSVVAFGVAAMAVGLGIVLVLIGVALHSLARRDAIAST